MPLEEWLLEKIMENLENQCYTNSQTLIKTVEGLGIEYDEDVVCDVCRSVSFLLFSFYYYFASILILGVCKVSFAYAGTSRGLKL